MPYGNVVGDRLNFNRQVRKVDQADKTTVCLQGARVSNNPRAIPARHVFTLDPYDLWPLVCNDCRFDNYQCRSRSSHQRAQGSHCRLPSLRHEAREAPPSTSLFVRGAPSLQHLTPPLSLGSQNMLFAQMASSWQRVLALLAVCLFWPFHSSLPLSRGWGGSLRSTLGRRLGTWRLVVFLDVLRCDLSGTSKVHDSQIYWNRASPPHKGGVASPRGWLTQDKPDVPIKRLGQTRSGQTGPRDSEHYVAWSNSDGKDNTHDRVPISLWSFSSQRRLWGNSFSFGARQKSSPQSYIHIWTRKFPGVRHHVRYAPLAVLLQDRAPHALQHWRPLANGPEA